MEPIRLSDLRKLPPEEQEACFERCSHATNLNGELTELDARIARFEQIYEMSSETLGCVHASSGKQTRSAPG